MDEDDLEAKYICPICCEVFKNPVITACLHRFCKDCMKDLLKSTTYCPVCRSMISERELCDDRNLQREILKSTVICKACGQEFALLHFNHHSTTCKKRTIPQSQFKHVNPASLPPNRSTFTCPLCSRTDLDCPALVKHCNEKHKSSRSQVVCPVCASMPWGNKDQVSSNFVSHLNMRHKFDYDTYVDYEQDDEQSLRAAIEASLVEK